MKKSKLISGLRRGGSFSPEERRLIIEDYLSSGLSKQEIWSKYYGEGLESGRILRWMRQQDKIEKKINFRAPKLLEMLKSTPVSDGNIQLKQKIAELEKSLLESELRSVAYRTAIDIAEKELRISILKKSNTKPSIK